MTRQAIGVILLLAAGVVALRVSLTGEAAPPAGPQARSIDGVEAVTIVFGKRDVTPTAWDGSASISAGTIERIAGYHFTEKCAVGANNSWVCASHAWTPFQQGMNPREQPQPHGTMLQTVGVTIYYRAPADARIEIKLANNRSFSFRPADLPEIDDIYPLDNSADVHRSPVVEQVTGGEYEDDFASIAAGDGSVWVAWQAYRDKADRVFLRRYRGGQWGEALEATEKPGDLFMTGVAAANGKAVVVWSERRGANFQLVAREYDGARFGGTEALTASEGNHLFHRVAADRAGNVHVAYQSWRRSRSNIYLRSRVAGTWQPEIELSDRTRDARADDWNPAVAADRDGTVWVAWDGYAGGSYNIYMRAVRGGKPGPLMKVTDSPRYHAHASLAVDAGNRVWVAWEEAPENWGKDVGFLFQGGTGLYDNRTVKVAAYAGGRWMAPLRQPGEIAPPGFRDFVASPRLVASSDGHIWLLLRPMTSSKLPTTHWKAGGKWEVCATYYAGDRWSPLLMAPDSVGRNAGELDAAADRDGNVYVAMVTDHKLWGGPNFGHDPGNNDVMFTRLRTQNTEAMALAPRAAEEPAGRPSEPREKEEIARLRNYRIEAGGKQYQIYRGDLHRHTEISLDGAGDGTLWDAYRYAFDAAGLDFQVVTDHQSGQNEYTWWRIEKAADMFNVPGYFTAVYGTERSVGYPNGHRNLLFAQRGVPILPIGPEERTAKVNSGPILYPFLKKYGGIATPHSSHTGMGTDWRDNDPEVDPIVEIWEGSRTSVEHERAPLAPNAEQTELWAGGYRPLGFVWNAWAKGYKLGVQASSDHASTHLSYTCVIAENGTREGLIDAMRRRHTYAATRNLLLDYRLRVEGRTWLQGDELRAGALPEVYARIEGTGPLKEVVIVRDNESIYSQKPDGPAYELRYRDNALKPGRHYYYVRVEQQDRNMAWSSPIWVDYRPE